MRAEVESLEARIGHTFAGPEILRRALTHSSHAYDHTLAGSDTPLADNEQMEFLGDSVLGFLVSEMLVSRFPRYPEGKLSKLKHHLVSATHLLDVAHELEIGQYLQLGRSEEMSGGREKKGPLVNAVEAVIAAIYLDGGIEAARRFVLTHVVPPGTDFGEDSEVLGLGMYDYKGALQELAQARKLPHPRYSVIREQGPSHHRTFTVEVRVGKEWSATGDGLSKKSAAQKAARDAYDRLLGVLHDQG